MEKSNELNSYNNTDALKAIICKKYPILCKSVELLREMIGFVYKIDTDTNSYIFKLYRNSKHEEAIKSLGIMQYLQSNDFPLAPIMLTNKDEPFIVLNTSKGTTIGALTEYISGQEPDVISNIEYLGNQTGYMHKIMQSFPEKIPERGKDFYINRYLNLLGKLDYDQSKIRELISYGDELWATMQMQQRRFCHGDLHSGNMIQEKSGRILVLDFDVAGKAYSVIDAATLCNRTGFNKLEQEEYNKTSEMFEKYIRGYNLHQGLSELSWNALLAFIAIRHYELIATITECRKDRKLSKEFLDEQFKWLMQWREICSRYSVFC